MFQDIKESDNTMTISRDTESPSSAEESDNDKSSAVEATKNKQINQADYVLDLQDIMEILPHRYPFLLIDRILTIDREKELIVGLKNVTFNEPCFLGHFPGKPIMPGVLIIEALAQTACIYGLEERAKTSTKKASLYFMGIDNVKFKKPVIPGDTMYLYAYKVKNYSSVWIFQCEARVNGVKVAEGKLTAIYKDDK